MAKMEFTFWWGKSKFADKAWVAEMLKYYLTIEDFNKRIKEYVTKLELADILNEYVRLEDFNANNEHINELIDQIYDRIQEVINKHDEDFIKVSNDMQALENEIESAMEAVRATLDKHTADISANHEQIENLKQQQRDLIEQFKQARLWNQKGLWNAQTSYKIGDVVGYEPDKTLYVSVTEPNVGNTPSKDSLVWFDLSGVQSVQWDDYYTKLQVDALVQNNTALINALSTRVDTNQSNIRTNTSAISTLDSKVNVLTTQMNNTAKTNTSNTYASGTRNIYNTLPEVYTSSTLPTKDVELTTKKYVDNKVAGVVTLGANNEFTGTNTFNGQTKFTNQIFMKNNNGIGFQDENNVTLGFITAGKTDGVFIQPRNSAGQNMGSGYYFGDTNNVSYGNQVTTKTYVDNKVDGFIKSKKVYWSSWSRVNESEHSGYYNSTFNYSNSEWANKTVFAIRIHTKNNSYSIQYGFQQNGSWIDLYIAGNRSFYNNMDYVELFYF